MAELIWKGKQRPRNDDESIAQEQRPLHTSQLVTGAYYTTAQEGFTSKPLSSIAWYNRLIQGDKNEILSALQREFRATVDLIYIDPPFMTGRTFKTGRTSNHEMQFAYSDTWHNDQDSYLQWLYETLHLLYMLLAPDGSLYIHLDWRATHYARMMLDEIFASTPASTGAGFKNEIIWHYQSGGRAKQHFARKHDSILLYTKSKQYCFHSERVGIRRGTQKRNHMRKEIDSDGRISWSIRSAGRIYRYDEDSTLSASDVWSDISHLHQRDPERTGYATQKPEALLERIIMASSEEHDLVLDCFCGSGVTPAVAQKLGRRWIASDQSALAITTTQSRLLAQVPGHPFVLQYSGEAVETAHTAPLSQTNSS